MVKSIALVLCEMAKIFVQVLPGRAVALPGAMGEIVRGIL
jgi:hypothetical protein